MDINDSEDLNIEDYTVDELSKLFELPTPISAESILAKLNSLIDKFISQNNPDFVDSIILNAKSTVEDKFSGIRQIEIMEKIYREV